MKKRGQLYLLAAIVLVTVIVGFIAISNYSKISSVQIHDLGKELEIEGGKVLDYGIYNGLDTATLLEEFIEDYSQYREMDELYFVSGNTGELIVTGYQKLSGKSIVVNVGEDDSPMNFDSQTALSETFVPSGNKAILTVNDEDYEFNLGAGENFYFIMIKTIEGEEHIYVGD